MNEDQLSRSLEDLFSDVSLPEPEASGDREPRRKERERESAAAPTESLFDGVGGQAPPYVPARQSSSAEESVSLSSTEAPAAKPDATSRSADRRPPTEDLYPAEPPALETRAAAPARSTGTIPGRPDHPIDPRWREKLLRASLYGGLGIGLVVAGLGSYRAFAAGRGWLIPFYLLATSLLPLVTFWEPVPHSAQAATLLAWIYTVGLLDLIQFGSYGDGRIYLLILPVLAALLLGKHQGAVALLLSFVTQAASRWAISTGRFVPLAQPVTAAGQADWWWVGALTFLLVGAGLLALQGRSNRHLVRAVAHGRKLASHLASHRARLKTEREELKERHRQLDLVIELGRIAASRLGVDRVLDRAVQLIPDHLDGYLASLFLLDESGETLTLRAATGAIGAQLEAEGLRLQVGETSIVGWTASHGRPYVAPEVSADDVYRPHPVLGGTMSEAAVPLKADGFLLGVLDLQSGSRDAFGEVDVRVLQGIADQLAVVVQRARQSADELTLLEATSPLYRANRRLNRAATVDQVVRAIVDSVTETEADGCLVGAFEPSSGDEAGGLRYMGMWPQITDDRVDPEASDEERDGDSPKRRLGMKGLRPGVALPLSESPFPVALMERFWWATDLEQDHRLSEDVRGVLQGVGARACVNVPLQAYGRDVGHILVLREKPGSFSRKSMQLFDVLGGQAAVALVRARESDQAQRHARREELASKAAAHMHQSLDIESVLNTAVRDIGETLGLAALDVRLGPVPRPLKSGNQSRGNGDGSPSEWRPRSDVKGRDS